EPAEEAADRGQDLAHEVGIAGRLMDAQDRARDDRRLDRRGKERIGERDRVLAKRCLVRALLPEKHVGDESIRLGALHQAADLLLRERWIDLHKGDRVERTVPEPLKGIARRRRTHKVVAAAAPGRDPALAIAREYAARVGGDTLPVGGHARGLSGRTRAYVSKRASARAARVRRGAKAGRTPASEARPAR